MIKIKYNRHNRKHKKISRTLEKDYIDGLKSLPLIPIKLFL
jgi:hypothetical protein